MPTPRHRRAGLTGGQWIVITMLLCGVLAGVVSVVYWWKFVTVAPGATQNETQPEAAQH